MFVSLPLIFLLFLKIFWYFICFFLSIFVDLLFCAFERLDGICCCRCLYSLTLFSCVNIMCYILARKLKSLLNSSRKTESHLLSLLITHNQKMCKNLRSAHNVKRQLSLMVILHKQMKGSQLSTETRNIIWKLVKLCCNLRLPFYLLYENDQFELITLIWVIHRPRFCHVIQHV